MITLTSLQIRREIARHCRRNSIPVTHENGVLTLPSLRSVVRPTFEGLNYVRVSFFENSGRRYPFLDLEYLSPVSFLSKIERFALSLRIIHKEVLYA